MLRKILVVDSHTEGEPTRVIIGGGPDLGTGSLIRLREKFRQEFDLFRSAVVHEPRGSDAVVGALLCEPGDPTCVAGVIFFNNVGYLGMCGHGTMGVVATLSHLGRLNPGVHRIETPVGIVTAELHRSGEISVTNVASYRYQQNISIDVPGIGSISGDIAWGGNWFFLMQNHGQELHVRNVDMLTSFTWQIRQALAAQGITGRNGEEIDHIELFGPPVRPDADSRNFVLCPGKAYDRSPCGTGTCAKMACLFEDGILHEGQTWRQESIVGSLFKGWVSVINNTVHPTICGSAFVNGEATLLIDEHDPFCWGIR